MNPGTNIKEKGRPTIHFGMIQIIVGLMFFALTGNAFLNGASYSYFVAANAVVLFLVIEGIKSTLQGSKK